MVYAFKCFIPRKEVKKCPKCITHSFLNKWHIQLHTTTTTGSGSSGIAAVVVVVVVVVILIMIINYLDDDQVTSYPEVFAYRLITRKHLISSTAKSICGQLRRGHLLM